MITRSVCWLCDHLEKSQVTAFLNSRWSWIFLVFAWATCTLIFDRTHSWL
ncbi:hypothetical protein NDU88_003380, partial [Pleurodeles waltl]